MQLTYKLKTFNYDREKPFNVKDYLYSILKERGIDNPEAWLNTTKKDEYDPALLVNIDLASEILHEELSMPEPYIYLQVDSDTDGYTSSSIMYYFITHISPNAVIQYNLHEGKQHGLNIQEALTSRARLIIMPDAGTNEDKEQQRLLKNKKKYIILDHHELSQDIDINNKAIVNNQVNYPNKDLSGAGMALKFCQYYARKYNLQYDEDMLYALASIGIVADVMNLRSLENKYIVDFGLSKIHKHAYFHELLKDKGGKYIDRPTLKDIGWTIGPNLNAVIRLGSMEEKTMLFNALVEPNRNVISEKRGDKDVVTPLWSEMLRISKNIKSKQSRLVKKGMDIINEKIQDGEIDLDYNILVYVDEYRELPFELSGLIANKLLSLYRVPVILLKHYEDPNDKSAPAEWRGSVRGTPTDGCENLKDILNTLSGVTFAEGHAFACGIGIEKESFDSFYIHAKDVLSQFDFNTQLYLIDEIVNAKDFNYEMAELFANEDIWGHGIEKPVVLLENIDCSKAEFMGVEANHVKISTPKINVVAFDDRELVETFKHSKKYTMSAIGEFSWDTYGNDVPKLQFIVQDYELYENNNDGADWSDF